MYEGGNQPPLCAEPTGTKAVATIITVSSMEELHFAYMEVTVLHTWSAMGRLTKQHFSTLISQRKVPQLCPLFNP